MIDRFLAWPAAILTLLALSLAGSPAFAADDPYAARRQQFLDAEKFLAANHPEEARQILFDLANSDWPLADAAADKLRAMADGLQDAAGKANWQRFLVDRFPTSLYRPDALLDLAANAVESDPKTAAPLLQTYLRDYPERDDGHALWLLSEALLRLERRQEAAVVAAQAAYWSLGPFAAKARLRLDELARDGVAVTPPSPTALWTRIVESYAQKQFAAAGAYAERFAEIYGDGPRAFRAYMAQVDCLLARHQRDGAKSLLETLAKKGASVDERLAATLRLKRLDKKLAVDKKRSFYEAVAAKATAPEARLEARRALLDLEMGEDRLAPAAAWADSLLQENAAELLRPEEIYWKAGFAHYLLGDYNQAVDSLRKLLEASPQDRDGDRAQYWLARASYRLGDQKNALALFRQCYDRWQGTYYGLAAEAWLLALGEPRAQLPLLPFTAAPPAAPGIVVLKSEWEQQNGGGAEFDDGARQALDAYIAMGPAEFTPAFRAVRELLALGRGADGLQRLNFIKDRICQTGEGPYFLSVAYSLCGDFQAAALAAQRAFEQVREGRLADPHALTSRRRFPLLYKEQVFEAAKNHNLDPFLLFSVIKQESAFQTAVTSSAGARGLMQVMPGTGRIIARKRRLKKFNPTDLYKIDVSLDFGSWYLADLLDDAGRDLAAALAGYNAGISRPRRWWMQYEGRDYDELIELIPFDETRGYVLGIFRNYEMYSRLHGDRQQTPDPPSVFTVLTQKVKCLP